MQNRFEPINEGFNSTFTYGNLSIGLVVPIEHYGQSTIPKMDGHLERAMLADRLGFKSLWVRDVPMHLPSFGDAGQTYDPFTYLGFLAGQTKNIALGVASIALPLHHPIHVAKSAATIDHLSKGRMILGIASGDRLEEYPATGNDYKRRGEAFRDAFTYISRTKEDFPTLKNNLFGELNGTMDVLPKPYGKKIPTLVTGHSQQNIEWVAENGDGWMYYPRNLYMQEMNIKEWRQLVKQRQVFNKPFMQPLYIDLQEDDDFKPQGIHLGIRTGIHYLNEYLAQLKSIGVNHVALNLRFNTADVQSTLEKLASRTLPIFHKEDKS